jgi:hypothetical protein
MPDASVTTRRVLLGGAAAAGLPLLASARKATAQTLDEGSVALRPIESGRNVVQGQSSAVLPLAVRAVDGQTANLQEWQDSSGNALAAVGPQNGRLVRPGTRGKAPFVWEVGGADFSDGQGGQVFDPVSYFGYNVRDGGEPLQAGEPYASWTIEADYHDGQKRTIEQYLEVRNKANNVNLRPLFFQFNRDATTPQSMFTGARIVGNPLTFCVPDDTLDASRGNSPDRIVAMFWAHNVFEFVGKPGTDANIRVGAAPGQAASLMLGANGTTNAFKLMTVANNLNHAIVSQNSRTVMHIFSTQQGAAGASIAVGAQDNTAAGVFDTAPSHNGLKGLVVRGRSGMTANMLELQDSSSQVLSGFNKGGHFFTAKNSAPADSDIASGQAFLWFDQLTSRLMVKAKDALGRVRTGSVNLS